MLHKLSNIALCLVLLSAFAGCSRHYEVGDYFKKGSLAGVVVDVTPEGGILLLSLDEACALDADSAAVWASSFGDAGWHLPDKEEMQQIRRHRSLINQTLENRGLGKILTNHTFYWTSTACSASHFFACGPDGIHCYFSTNNGSLYRARAVRTISTEITL